MIDKRSQVRRIQSLLTTLSQENYWGKLEVCFENGNVIYATQVKQHKPKTVEATLIEVSRFVQDLLNGKNNNLIEELSIKITNGKPHLILKKQGSLEYVVDSDIVEQGEKYIPEECKNAT